MDALASDISNSGKLEQALVKNTELVEGWKVLHEADPNGAAKLGKKGELEDVKKYLDANPNKNIDNLAKEIKDAGGYRRWSRPKVTFINNYNPKHSGKIADFTNKDGSSFGRLYKNVRSEGIEYTFKWRKSDGNIVVIRGQLASLDNKGFIEFDLNLKKVTGKGLGKLIFEDAVACFGRKNIKGMKAIWEWNNPNYAIGMSDNIVQYRAALAKGLSPEKAALETGSARRAKSLGFTNVRLTEGNNYIVAEFY